MPGVWYRPPQKGETSFIESLHKEWLALEGLAVGTILCGDMNVHHERWLKHSSGTTPEGTELWHFCKEHGFEERVRKPTREKYLLDLVLTDMGASVSSKVLPKVDDHNQVLTTVSLGLPVEVQETRECWVYSKANWAGLRRELASTNWDFLDNLDANEAQRSLTD